MTDAENGKTRGEDAMNAETNPAPLKRTMSAGTISQTQSPYTRHGSSLTSLNTMDVFNMVPKEKLDDNRTVSSRKSILRQVARKPKAFHPNSEFRVMLDCTYFIAGLYTMFAAIYLVCFGIEKPPGTFLVASGLADAAFIADLVFNLNTGFVKVEKGVTEVVLDILPSMIHYVFNGLIRDAIISCPVIIIQYAYFYFFGSDPSKAVTWTLWVLHVCKIICAIRMRKILDKFLRNNPGRNFQVALAASLSSIVAITHLVACLWMVIARISYSEPSEAFLKIYATDDVDECAMNTHNCDFSRATCTNTAGSFTCTCHHGLLGNGTECYECPEYTSTFTRMTCRLYGQALAEPLVFSPPTMEMIESGKYVNDVDECLKGAHNCAPQALCMNTPGSFQCTCQLGYEGPGEFCHACNDPDTIFAHMNLYQQYQCALYFSINIGFRVGDGYVETKSSPERILFLFAMCAQVCLISYIASRCALGSSAKFDAYSQYLADRHTMSQYFVARRMAKSDSRKEAEKCYDHHWDKQKGAPRVEQTTLALLPPGAQITVFCNLHQDAFSSVSFFGDKRRDSVFWQYIMENSQVFIHGDGDVISVKGEIENALYVIKSGQVKEVDEQGKALRIMKRPCHWGEGALLMVVAKSARYAQVSVVAKGMVEVFMIDAAAVEGLVNRDAEVKQLCLDYVHDEIETYMSIKYNAMSKRLCAWAVEKAQIEFREHNMGRDDLRPRANGRLR